jgi:diacylglycerol kinase family enzyme
MSLSPFRSPKLARPAAIVALLAAVVIAFAVLNTVVQSPDDLIAALLSLGAVSACTWFVLTRHGVRRWLVLPVGVLALVILIGTTLGDHLQFFLLLAVLLTLFGVTARHAVRHKAPGRMVTRHAQPASRALGGVLIINPRSGGGKAERFDLATEAQKRGIEPVLLEDGGNLGELAERACSCGADVIGMAGGDGSQALLASVAMEHDVAHVCVPAGTRNHFALDLGLDRNDVVGALDAFTDGVEHRIDLASVNEHVFINNASLGLYAEVVQSQAYRNAKLRTWKRMLPEMVRGGDGAIELHFDGPDARPWRDATLVVVSNNPYFIKRLRGVGTRPRLDTGGLGILAARMTNARTVAHLVALGAIGQALRSRGMRQWSSGEFVVSGSRPIAIGLDGEAFELTPPLRFVSLPGVLRVRVPRLAKGQSPTAARISLSRRNLALLLQIAVGRPIHEPVSQQEVGVDDGAGDVDELAVGGPRVVAEEVERRGLVD